MGMRRSASWTNTTPRAVKRKASPYIARLAESFEADWLMAAPTDAGSAEAIFAAMRIEVPFPNLRSVSSEAICERKERLETRQRVELQQNKVKEVLVLL